MSETNKGIKKPRNFEKCYQCRKDKKPCERQEPWPRKCDRCETLLHYRCSEDLTMAEYNEWQAHQHQQIDAHEPSTVISLGHTAIRITSRDPGPRAAAEAPQAPALTSTGPDYSSLIMTSATRSRTPAIASTTSLVRPTANLAAYDFEQLRNSNIFHRPVSPAPGSRSQTQDHRSMLHNSFTLPPAVPTQAPRTGMQNGEMRQSLEDLRDHPVTEASLGSSWASPGSNWVTTGGVGGGRMITPARSQEELDAERDRNAESLLKAIKDRDLKQVRKLVKNDNPDLNPMKSDSIRTQAVHKFLEVVRSLKPDMSELNAIPALFLELLESGAVDQVQMYRQPSANHGTVLHELCTTNPLPQKVRGTIARVLEVWANSSFPGLGDLIGEVDATGKTFIHQDFSRGQFRHYLKPLLPKFLPQLIVACNIQDGDGYIPLHFVSEDMEFFNFLLVHTRTLSTVNHQQGTPIHTLTMKSYWNNLNGSDSRLSSMRLLLEAGGLHMQRACKTPDVAGNTLLHLCPDLRGLRELMKPQNGLAAAIDAQNSEGQTPLLSVFCRDYDPCEGVNVYPDRVDLLFMAEYLIVQGANVNLKDRFGRNALVWLLDWVDRMLSPHFDGINWELGIELLVNCRMARRLTLILLRNGVKVEDEDQDGANAKSLAQCSWDRWKKSKLFVDPEANKDCLEIDEFTFFMQGIGELAENPYFNFLLKRFQFTCPELAPLRAELRGCCGFNRDKSEWAKFICQIVQEDLETLVNTIKNKATRKRKRTSTPDLTSDGMESE